MKRKTALLICLALVFTLLALPAGAVTLDPPANGYVLDEAGVLESDTIEHIVDKNEDLSNSTGAAIAVVTVDFLNGQDIDDYAADLFNDWGIGDAKANNGLLILLAIGEDNYSILQGTGLQSALPTSTLGEYAYEYLEEDFAAGDYDDGVEKLFDAFYQWFEDYYAGQGSQNAPGGAVAAPGQPERDDGGAFALIGFAGTVVALLIAFVIIMLAVETVRRATYARRSIYTPGVVYRPFFIGRPRPPRPPRPPRAPRPPRPPRSPAGGLGPTGFSSGGSSRGGGFRRSSGFGHRSSGSFGGFRGGGRSGFGGGASRGGGFRRH